MQVKALSICHPHYAAQVLEDDRFKFISAIMPCCIRIYQTTKGEVYIAVKNAGLMRKMFGAKVAAIMKDVFEEEPQMIREIVAST